jgi:succinate dehydrogenase / fumarate reductase cytochrome b subunit
VSSLVTTLTETLRYRGAIGQWSWLLHRISGLGVVVFLLIHVIDTSWAVFYPRLYEEAIAVYQTPVFTIGEFLLVACVVYHAYNGLRIVILDYRPRLWRYQQSAARYVLIATAITLVPVFLLMLGHVLDYYDSDPTLLGLDDVVNSLLPFILGTVVAVVAALVLSVLTGAIAGEGEKVDPSKPKTGNNIERFWWSYMRISGLLILPLVFGHLLLMHVLQGVFDISVQNADVIGTTVSNASGTAVEFTGARWDELVLGIKIWRVYDIALLAFAVLHGANGLRYVLTDYTMSDKTLHRAAVYVCVIGAVVLLLVGGGALIQSAESTAVDMALEAREELGLEIRVDDEADAAEEMPSGEEDPSTEEDSPEEESGSDS